MKYEQPQLTQVMHGWYAETVARLGKASAIGFIAVTVLTAISLWGQWSTMALFGVGQLVVIALNFVVMLQLKPSRSTELLRLLFNAAAGAVLGHLSGWAIPVWGQLPLVALANDDFNRRNAYVSLVSFAVAMDAWALYDGVPWAIPASATLIAAMSHHINQVRFGWIRRMLSRVESQRNDLLKANAELKEAVATRDRMELELRQSQKLEAIGRLAAGVAHEINTPVQFVTDSLAFVGSATESLLQLVETMRPWVSEAHRSEFEGAADAADVGYLTDEVPEALARASTGLDRVAAIVKSLRQFAHPDSTKMVSTDLNTAVRATLTIAAHEYKLVADVETDFSVIPLVMCHVGEINQVILNIVVNASHAIEDVVRRTGRRGRITVKTASTVEEVVISITDTGGGIPDDVASRMFEPFFTTKEFGRGTGQGLAIARSVMEKHGGSLRFKTTLGEGTTFFICLPTGTDPARPAAPSLALPSVVVSELQ